jgi:hypothetical protein
MADQQSSPVLVIAGNRPEITKQIVQLLLEARPSKLYFASDAADPNVQGEAELIHACRSICMNINWPCEIKTLFQEVTLGTEGNSIAAIDWLFSGEEEGIILDANTVPELGFLNIAATLLKRYGNDQRIMHISGSDRLGGSETGDSSYVFSKIAVFGIWATWRWVWQKFAAFRQANYEIKDDKIFQLLFHHKALGDRLFTQYKRLTTDGQIPWEQAWMLFILLNNGLCITQNRTVVEGIKHPAFFISNRKADIEQLMLTYKDVLVYDECFQAQLPQQKAAGESRVGLVSWLRSLMAKTKLKFVK